MSTGDETPGATHSTDGGLPAPALPRASHPPAHPYLPRWIIVCGGWAGRLLLMAAALAVAVWLGAKVTLVLVAFFLGLVLTAVLRPIALALRHRMPRALATALSLITGFLVVAGILALTVVGLTGDWGGVLEGAEDGLGSLLAQIDRLGIDATGMLDIEHLGENIGEWVSSQAGSIASSALSVAGTLGHVAMALALGVFSAVYFLTSGDKIWAWFLAQLPRGSRPAWRTAGEIAWTRFTGYTLGTVLSGLIVGTLALVVLLVLGVPFAVPLAVLVLLGTFVPLIGAPTAMAIAALVALSTNGVWNGLAVLIAIALVGQVEGHLVQPLVVGRYVSLHPLVVAAGVTAGTLLAGLLGAVVAVPVLSITWAVFSELRTPPEPDDDPIADSLARRTTAGEGAGLS